MGFTASLLFSNSVTQPSSQMGDEGNFAKPASRNESLAQQDAPPECGSDWSRDDGRTFIHDVSRRPEEFAATRNPRNSTSFPPCWLSGAPTSCEPRPAGQHPASIFDRDLAIFRQTREPTFPAVPVRNGLSSGAFSPDGSRIVTASFDKTARIWDSHLPTMSPSDLLLQVSSRLAGISKLSRDEMRLATYPNDTPQIDPRKGSANEPLLRGLRPDNTRPRRNQMSGTSMFTILSQLQNSPVTIGIAAVHDSQ
jgi:WD40 repeat protein